MVTVHVITYNEELMIEFFINHYRKMFPNCIIKVYDNHSTDNTVKIAESFGCEIEYFESDNKLSDSKFLEIKNNCWKTSKTDWVVVCDCDELVEVTQDDLINESNLGTTIFKFIGYSMVNTGDTINLNEICLGYGDPIYNKSLLFNKSKINEIRYKPGCHQSSPLGIINYNSKPFRMLHYKYLGVEYTVSRYKLFSSRLSDENKKMGWSSHYSQQESKLRRFYDEMPSKNLTKLI